MANTTSGTRRRTKTNSRRRSATIAGPSPLLADADGRDWPLAAPLVFFPMVMVSAVDLWGVNDFEMLDLVIVSNRRR